MAESLLQIVIRVEGVRRYMDRETQKMREKPNYAMQIVDDAGAVVYDDLRCADNEYFCQVKGKKWIAYYQEHGRFPDEPGRQVTT